mgnify:CR=1 FL=1
MPVTINGDGSITGLSVGGLPNGSVNADTIAANAVTDAKISALSASKLTGALPSISGAALTGMASGGLTDFDEWYQPNQPSGNQQPITSWTQSNAADSRHGIKGGVMSHSSGIWTFPSTGYWFISFTGWTFLQNAANRYAQFRIMTTSNNSSYAEQASNGHCHRNWSGTDNGATYHSSHSQTIFDVQDTSNYKVRFDVLVANGSSAAMGGRNFTSFTVMKLGET